MAKYYSGGCLIRNNRQKNSGLRCAPPFSFKTLLTPLARMTMPQSNKLNEPGGHRRTYRLYIRGPKKFLPTEFQLYKKILRFEENFVVSKKILSYRRNIWHIEENFLQIEEKILS